MNQFSTLAIFLCATLALGSCSYGGGQGGYGGQAHRELSSYGQRQSGGGAAASAAAAAPVEIIAGGPRYGGSEHLSPILLDSGYGNSGSQYGQQQQQSYSAPQQSYSAPQQSYSAPQQSYSAPQQSYSAPQHLYADTREQSYSAPQQSYAAPQQSYSAPQQSYSAPQQSYSAPQQSYSAPQKSYGQQRGYGSRPRWSVQPAGATLLYPGQHSYLKYASAPEISKVLLPVRAAPPVAKLYIPENNYSSQGAYQVKQQSAY